MRGARARQAPTLFLMVGLPGAGKTVRARELAAERGALLMTPDAWMVSLFGQSQPDGKRDVLEGHLIALAVEALRLGTSVVLDFGLWGRDERSALRWMAASVGASCRVVSPPRSCKGTETLPPPPARHNPLRLGRVERRGWAASPGH